MKNTASFIFVGNLLDFLPSHQVHQPLSWTFTGNPAVKDVIEAIGIPHTEVAGIAINNLPVNFTYQLQQGDQVTVYPYSAMPAGWPVLAGEPPLQNGFIADIHLGTLARNLRLLGFDVAYDKLLTETQIADYAAEHKHIVLTRSLPLLKHSKIQWGYWLRSQQTDMQVQEVLRRYHLTRLIMPFKRCTVCNGQLNVVEKEAIKDLLPPKTRLYFNEFWQCDHCKRIYWKGSHYDRMMQWIEKIKLESVTG